MLAAAGPISLLVQPAATALVATAAAAWLLLARLVLVPAERAHVQLAVRLQERFDTFLFTLDWPEGLAGSKPGEEDVAAAARRLERDERLHAQIADGWYPSTAGLRYPVDVLVAQIASVAWGRRQHRAYYRVLSALTAVTVIMAIILGASMTLAQWLITFLLPALPALVDAADLAVAHRDISGRKLKIERRLQVLWERELVSPGSLTPDDCRGVQDEAFKLRQQGLQIPQWFYWLTRKGHEMTMQDAANARRTQYEEAAGASDPAARGYSCS